MNGICELRVDSKVYPLKFGMIAIEELERRMIVNHVASNIKAVVDLIYAGMLNYAIVKEQQVPLYAQVYELIEEQNSDADFDQQINAAWVCFNESRFGSDWIKKMEALKKKGADDPSTTVLTGTI
jgi:predicted RNA methylase